MTLLLFYNSVTVGSSIMSINRTQKWARHPQTYTWAVLFEQYYLGIFVVLSYLVYRILFLLYGTINKKREIWVKKSFKYACWYFHIFMIVLIGSFLKFFFAYFIKKEFGKGNICFSVKNDPYFSSTSMEHDSKMV